VVWSTFSSEADAYVGNFSRRWEQHRFDSRDELRRFGASRSLRQRSRRNADVRDCNAYVEDQVRGWSARRRFDLLYSPRRCICDNLRSAESAFITCGRYSRSGEKKRSGLMSGVIVCWWVISPSCHKATRSRSRTKRPFVYLRVSVP